MSCGKGEVDPISSPDPLQVEAHLSDLLAYWYQALSSPFGIELVCSDPEGTRAKLYAARKAAQDTDLDKISVSLSPFDPTKLWLKKDTSNA